LHLAHSSRFCGAGIVAGGPYRCAESFRAAAFLAADAFEQSAINLCKNPLPQTAPNAELLAQLARATARSGEIEPIANLAHHRIYIFTGSKDDVVPPATVARTRQAGLAPVSPRWRQLVSDLQRQNPGTFARGLA
jgi:hypothetical protein